MTIQDFKTLLSDSTLGSTGTEIITLFNTASNSTSTIDAVAIRIGKLTVNDLRQATQLSFKTPSGSGYLHISLQTSTLPLRTINTSIVSNYFVYEIDPENQRAIITTPNTGSDGYLKESTNYLLEPTLTYNQSNISDYSVLMGSVDQSRESQYTVKSDRSSTRVTDTLLNPLNINSIIADTAQPANIQDSNYTSTTWINPRYEGSKITTLTNGGTDPFIQGTFFEGAYFSNSTKDSTILASFTAGAAQYKSNFSSGILEVPKYVVEKLNLATAQAYNPSASFLQVSSSNTPLNKNLVLGDLLVFSSSAGFSQEVLQVIPPTGSLGQIYFPYEFRSITPTKELVQIRVKRGYSNTKAQSISTPSELYRIVNTKAYDIVSSNIVPVKQGKLLIRDTNDIVQISSEGLIISGSSRIDYQDL